MIDGIFFSDCEEEEMADLNQYCSTGVAVHDSDNKLQCNCPHGMFCCRALSFNIVAELILYIYLIYIFS